MTRRFGVPGGCSRPVKHASLILPFMSVAAILVACATSDNEATEQAPIQQTAPTETAKLPPPSDTTPPPPPEKQCVSTCSTDADCQNSCPSVANGIQCCDQNTKKCFATSQAQCPAPEQPPSDPPAY